MKLQLSDFDFQMSGHGHYKVTYTTPSRGLVYSAVTNNMPLIDATKNCEDAPKMDDLIALRNTCKRWPSPSSTTRTNRPHPEPTGSVRFQKTALASVPSRPFGAKVTRRYNQQLNNSNHYDPPPTPTTLTTADESDAVSPFQAGVCLLFEAIHCDLWAVAW